MKIQKVRKCPRYEQTLMMLVVGLNQVIDFLNTQPKEEVSILDRRIIDLDNDCQCKDKSCKIPCENNHTHKTFSCHKCKPEPQIDQYTVDKILERLRYTNPTINEQYVGYIKAINVVKSFKN